MLFQVTFAMIAFAFPLMTSPGFDVDSKLAAEVGVPIADDELQELLAFEVVVKDADGNH